jgi:hypothetical protein
MDVFRGMSKRERRIALQAAGFAALGFLVGSAAMLWWMLHR